MIQRREDLRLALEAGQPLRVRREGIRQHLDGDVPLERRVARSLDLAHAAFADQGGDFVGAEARATRLQRHSIRRHETFQLFKPVLHDDNLRRRGRLFGFLDHQKALAIGRDVISDSN